MKTVHSGNERRGRTAGVWLLGQAIILVILWGCASVEEESVPVCRDQSLRPLDFAAADVNADGAPDLVVGCSRADGPASSGVGRVEVLLGEGRGFASPTALGEFANGITGVTLRDLTGDGVPELLVNAAGAHERTMLIYRNDGAGAFAEESRVSTGFTLSAPAVVDSDDDGDLDVVMPADNHNFRNDGSATDPGPFVQTRFVPIDERRNVGLADVDGDGATDAVHLLPSAGKVRLYGTADGTPRELVLGKEVRQVRRVMAGADLNDDGRVDLIALSADTAEGPWLMALSQAGDWALAPALGTLGAARGLHLGDLNGDGLDDLMTRPAAQPDISSYSLRVAYGRGEGSFGPPQARPVAEFPQQTALVDLDSDGRQEVLYLDMTGSLVRWLR